MKFDSFEGYKYFNHPFKLIGELNKFAKFKTNDPIKNV